MRGMLGILLLAAAGTTIPPIALWIGDQRRRAA
jgi:hypothetical protein